MPRTVVGIPQRTLEVSQMMAGKVLGAVRSVSENREAALEWLRKSAEHGNADAWTNSEQALHQHGRK